MKPKILIADPSPDLVKKILQAPDGNLYEFAVASKGEEVLAKIASFSPQLILLDLLLPEMHAIELLRKIRANPEWTKLGVIIASTNSMIQNFHATIHAGVDYFVAKPLDISFLYTLFSRFFQGTLVPEPFETPMPSVSTASQIYRPHTHDPHSYIKFWGTRGSNPVSGPEYIRFGGNTACLEVCHGSDRIIIDAGTGIRPLGQILDAEKVKTLHLFLSHTHWDHITGFPFFAPIYQPDVQLVIWSPIGFEKSTKDLFTEMLAYAYFPVRLEDIKAKISFNDLREGQPVSIGDITIDSHYAFHPGATLCFKIHVAGKTFGYATDNEMFLGYHGNPNAINKESLLIKSHQNIIDFFKHCDFLVHEAQFTPSEYQRRVGWGHCSISNAALLCKFAEIKQWIFTHHDPTHTDEQLLAKLQLHKDILADCHIPCEVHSAFDGMTIPL